jgi:hypothetical protein
MKTKTVIEKQLESKAMKTRNNVQKPNLKTGVVLFGLVFLSIVVSAQKQEKDLLADNSTKKMKTGLISTNTKLVSDLYKVINEKVLQLENWMIDGEFFTKTNDSLMGNTNPASINSTSGSTSSLDENQMTVEKWMVEPLFW